MGKLHDQFIKQIKISLMSKLLDINVLWMINESISHDNNHAQELEQKYGLIK